MAVSLHGDGHTDGIKIGPVFQEGAYSLSTAHNLVIGFLPLNPLKWLSTEKSQILLKLFQLKEQSIFWGETAYYEPSLHLPATWYLRLNLLGRWKHSLTPPQKKRLATSISQLVVVTHTFLIPALRRALSSRLAWSTGLDVRTVRVTKHKHTHTHFSFYQIFT